MSLSQVTALTVNLVQDGEANELQVIDDDYYFNGSLKIISIKEFGSVHGNTRSSANDQGSNYDACSVQV
jgi:hypothetical protein